MMSSKACKWRYKAVENTKTEIKQVLTHLEQNQGSQKKFEFITNEISHLEDDTSSQGYLRRFIFVVNALFHHQRHGGLSKKEISDLAALAYALLQLNGVKPTTSQLSYLYGDLHWALSEIALKNGDVLGAAWEQQLGIHLSAKNSLSMGELKLLSMGIHSLRLGNAILAQHYLKRSLEGELPQAYRERAWIVLMRSYRFAHEREDFDKLLIEIENQKNSVPFQTELEWEKLCFDINTTNNLDEMIKSVKKGKSHYTPSYLLETIFWIRAVPSIKWFDRLPKLSSLAQYKELSFQSQPLFYSFAQQFEKLYDAQIPFTHRLNGLNKVLKKASQLRNIDKEMIVWLAATRWLYRSRYYDMSALIFEEYKSLSLRVTKHKCQDSFGICSDLLKTDWLSKI